MSMIDDGLAYFQSEAAAFLESTVAYARGASSAALGAIIDEPAQLDFSVLGMTPGLIDANQANPLDMDQPFNFDASKLILGGNLTTPQAGDEITATVAGNAGVYEVLSPMGGGLPWEWINNRTRIRVHTKFLRTAP